MIVPVLAVLLVFTVLLFEFGGFAALHAVIVSALLSTIGVFRVADYADHVQPVVVHGLIGGSASSQRTGSRCSTRISDSGGGAVAGRQHDPGGERRLRPILMTALATMAG
jgi:multidrug efflux pump subunit AcrB